MAMKIQGGIRLSEYRNTKKLPITQLDRPSVVTLPLKSGLMPLVDAGDYVEKYYPVAKSEEGFTLSSPVAGKVLAAEQKYIIIENSNKADICPPDGEKPSSIEDITFEHLIEYCKRYGIYGAFSGIPLYVKLSESHGKSERLIINCIDSDPSSVLVRALTKQYARDLVLGIKVLLKAMGIKKAVIALDKKFTDYHETVKKHIEEKSGIVLAYLNVKYPMGNERLLLDAIYNTEFSCENEVWQSGYPVISAETVINLYQSLRDGYPVIYKTLTLSGDAVINPMNLRVPVGTHIGEIFSECELTSKSNSLFVANGLLNGYAVSEDSPVEANTNTVFAINRKKVKTGNCLKCARCTAFCPMHLVPFKFHENYETGKHEENIELGLYNCIECGCCAYMCVGKVDLLGEIRIEKYRTLTREESCSETMIFEPLVIDDDNDEYSEEVTEEVSDEIPEEIPDEVTENNEETEPQDPSEETSDKEGEEV